MKYPSSWHWNLLQKSSFAAIPFALLSFGPPKIALDQVVNNTKSLVVEALSQDKAGYKLCLRNTSTVAVSRLAISVTGSKSVCDLHTPRSLSVEPLISPNAKREILLSAPKSKASWGGPGGESCSAVTNNIGEKSVAPRIVVDAADFSDGSCEGDREKCAMMEAARLGVELQHRRIAALVEEEINRDENTVWVDTLALRVSALSDEPESAIIESIQARFQRPGSANKSLWLDMQSGLTWEKGKRPIPTVCTECE